MPGSSVLLVVLALLVDLDVLLLIRLLVESLLELVLREPKNLASCVRENIKAILLTSIARDKGMEAEQTII